MGSVWGNKAQEKESRLTPVMSVTKFSRFYQRLTSTKFGDTMDMCLSTRVVARSSTPTALRDTRSFGVASLTTGRAFATFPCGARTTIEAIILNLNMKSRRRGRGWFWPDPGKRADFPYHPNWKYLLLVFHNYFSKLHVRFVKAHPPIPPPTPDQQQHFFLSLFF